MCLNLADSDGNLLTAKKDMTVYKVIDDIGNQTFVTAFRRTEVEMGKTYKSKLGFSLNACAIEEGLHSFDSLYIAKFMSRMHRFQVPREGTLVVAKCIIPKGARYYSGTFNYWESYASDELTYVEIIK